LKVFFCFEFQQNLRPTRFEKFTDFGLK